MSERPAQEFAKEDGPIFASIVKNSPDICVVKDLQLRVIIANMSFARAIGVNSVEELIGKTNEELFVDPHNSELSKSHLKNELKALRLKPEEYIESEETLIYPDGKKHVLSARRFPIFDHDGTLMGTANISNDVTSLKEAEEELHQMEDCLKRLADIMHTSPDAISELKDAGLADLVNRWLDPARTTSDGNNSIKKELDIPNDPHILDKKDLMERLDNEDVRNRIISIFLNDAPGQFAKLKGHLEKGEMQKVMEYAHKIKGASANISGIALSRIAGEIEQSAKLDNFDDVMSMIPELEKQYYLLETVLKDL
ncbi:PAS domain S-box protein [Methanolobus sp. WCC4]|uniref:PAS domain S-box protein n=1 Tax=Methanolobus sp. WCC4 TaxID=3125784 RepID=UPI0030F8FB83